jgi:phage repressor protein C with HTH and peptisase S24 domain
MDGGDTPALSHTRIWAAIDAFAAREGISLSALARRAGLDPTTFNRSKRVGADGRPRWPSTESIAKVLHTSGLGIESFGELLAEAHVDRLPAVRAVPFLGFAEAAGPGHFDATGRPSGDSWDAVDFPGAADHDLYALEVADGTMHPLYRDGDVILVSPSAQVRRGDRVLIRTVNGAMLARTFIRRTARAIEVVRLGEEPAGMRLKAEDVCWMARIVWASQ